MIDKSTIDKCEAEIQKAVLAYENGEFIDIQTETTELVLLAKQYLKKSNDSQLIKNIAIAISKLIPLWIKEGDATWAAVDYLIEKLELDKTINSDCAVISETLDFFIGNDKPTDSKARFFLLEAFIHSGGKLQQSTIVNEEIFFKEDNPSFWLGLIIGSYQTQYIEGRIKEYIIEGHIDIGDLIPLIPEIYDKVDKDFPDIMNSFVDTFEDQESKNVLKTLFNSYMGESMEEYFIKVKNPLNPSNGRLFSQNAQYNSFVDNLNYQHAA